MANVGIVGTGWGARVQVPTSVALYMLNHKREALERIEQRYGLHVVVAADDALIPPAYSECPDCGELKRPHHLCQSCGHYGGREVVPQPDATTA